MLFRSWAEQSRSYKSWAIQADPNPIDEEFWHRRGVDVLDTSLEAYVAGLTAHLERAQTSGVG